MEADEENRIRMDDLEMREDIQKAVSSLWEKIDDNNLEECADKMCIRDSRQTPCLLPVLPEPLS